jgi:hypothetical protein
MPFPSDDRRLSGALKNARVGEHLIAQPREKQRQAATLSSILGVRATMTSAVKS